MEGWEFFSIIYSSWQYTKITLEVPTRAIYEINNILVQRRGLTEVYF